MAKDDQPIEFLFDPMRFVNDEAVRVMVPAELGAYAALFCNGWTQPEPGVIPENDRLLALLARCTPEEWAVVRPAVARCYDLEARPGFWVQRGTVATAALRRERLEHARAAGAKGGRSRWDAPASPGTPKPAPPAPPRLNLEGDPNGDPSRGPNGAPVPVRFGVVGLGEREPNYNTDLSASDWAGLFAEFWAAWPKGFKVGTGICEGLWAKIRPRSRAHFDTIMAGLERWKASARWAERDPNTGQPGHLIPNPKTWIGQGRWNDDIAAANRSDGIGWARTREEVSRGTSEGGNT